MIEKIYFDMDSVLADFERGVEELAGFKKTEQSSSTAAQDDAMWEAIKQVPHFYDKLELMPGAKEMFEYIYGKYGDRCEVLTGIPKPKRGIATAGEDKIAWMHRVLSSEIKVNVVFKEEKKNFCQGEDYILIDDLERNINEWKEFGGTGILHKSSEETLSIFKDIEDIHLIRAIRVDNSQSAWESLCERYKGTIKWHVDRKLANVFDEKSRANMYEDIYQEGWKEFIKAVKNFDLDRTGKASFRAYANSYIKYAVSNEFSVQLNRLGLTERPAKNQFMQAVFINSEMAENSNFDIPDIKRDDIGSVYDDYIQELKDSGEISDKGGYSETQRVIQILETLKLMTDENHAMSKADLGRCLSQYRMVIHHNSVKSESENTLKASIDKLLMEVDPLEYSEELEDKYLIKYEGYKDNRLANNLQSKKRAEGITNFYYQHPFSYSDLDKLIEVISFSDLLSEEEKLGLCNKLIKTASTHYENSFVGKDKLKLNSKAVSGRYSGSVNGARGDIADKLHILQQAMNQMVQVQFTFNRYDENGSLVPVSERKHILSPYRLVVYHDEFYCIGLKMDNKKIWHYRVDLMTDIEFIKDIDGSPVPVELVSGGVPSAISEIEWNPQKYMAEHLNMGYDEPRSIRVRIKNTDYTILQHWFGGNYRKLENQSDSIYDVVEIKTSPSLIVSWALSYGKKVEIMDDDIRNAIREQLATLRSFYEDTLFR